MEFGHHPDPATDFCLEVEAIENDITDRKAGLEPQIPDLGARIERAMKFKVGGDTGAIVAKNSLRIIEHAFKAGRAPLHGTQQFMVSSIQRRAGIVMLEMVTMDGHVQPPIEVGQRVTLSPHGVDTCRGGGQHE